MRRLLALLLVALALAGCASPAGEPLERGVEPQGAPGETREGWAEPALAEIRPGVTITTPHRDCASNFLFIRPDNTSVFLGSTAYCFRDMGVGTLVSLGASGHIGILVYNSWQTMGEIGEEDPYAHEYNDFAVIRIDESSRSAVSPGLVGFGGPTGLGDADALALGARVKEHSNLSLPGPWRDGIVTGKVADWALLVHSPTPAIPGMMGGAVVSPEGEALGIVVNIGVAPNAGANGVARLDRLMAYAEEHAYLSMTLQGAPLEGRSLR